MKAAARLKLYGGVTGSAPEAPAPSVKELPEFLPLSSGLLHRQVELPLQQNIVPLPYDALQLPTAVMGMLDLAGPGLPAGDVLFLDTETTGLSIGTGTLPFLIGLAWWQEERLTIRQLFLNSPGGEAALVKELDALFSRFPYLCTFNGKSYDVPLIRNRFALQRSTMKVFAHHFDLLHIWKRLLPRDYPGGFKQKNLETTLLRAPRIDDIEGAAIPGIYFDWIKYGVDNGLTQIIRHNELDMQGMIALYAEAAALFEQNLSAKKKDNPSTRIRIGRILFRNHQGKEALALLEPLLNETIERADDERILLTTLYRIYSRLDRNEEAAFCLDRLVRRDRSPFEMLLLLRFLEYRLLDYKAALKLIDEIPAIIDFTEPALTIGRVRAVALLRGEPLERRRARIRKKLATDETNRNRT